MLRDLVIEKLALEPSPAQYRGGLAMNVILPFQCRYPMILFCKSRFIQVRGVLKSELISHLRKN